MNIYFLLTPFKKSAGYFVHHFAPSNLQRIPKNVVFIIDQSGSMHGRKIHQVQFLPLLLRRPFGLLCL